MCTATAALATALLGSVVASAAIESRPSGRDADAPSEAALAPATASSRVIGTTVVTTRALVRINVGGSALEATPDHPFYVRGHGWLPASALTPGMPLDALASSADPAAGAVIATVERVAVPPTPVFNLIVERRHTYRVGASAALVHNNIKACGLAPAFTGQRVANRVSVGAPKAVSPTPRRLASAIRAQRADTGTAESAGAIATKSNEAAIAPNVVLLKPQSEFAARKQAEYLSDTVAKTHGFVVISHGNTGAIGTWTTAPKSRIRWADKLGRNRDELMDAGARRIHYRETKGRLAARLSPPPESSATPWYWPNSRKINTPTFRERLRGGFRNLETIGEGPTYDRVVDITEKKFHPKDLERNPLLAAAMKYEPKAHQFTRRDLLRALQSRGFERKPMPPSYYDREPTPVRVDEIPEGSSGEHIVFLTACRAGATCSNTTSAQVMANLLGAPVKAAVEYTKFNPHLPPAEGIRVEGAAPGEGWKVFWPERRAESTGAE